MGFPRSELSFPSPGDLPHPGIEPAFPVPSVLRILYPLSPLGSPRFTFTWIQHLRSSQRPTWQQGTGARATSSQFGSCQASLKSIPNLSQASTELVTSSWSTKNCFYSFHLLGGCWYCEFLLRNSFVQNALFVWRFYWHVLFHHRVPSLWGTLGEIPA